MRTETSLKLLALAPRATLTVMFVVFGAIAIFLAAQDLSPLVLFASVPAWLTAGMLGAARRRDADAAHLAEGSTVPAPPAVTRLTEDVARWAKLTAPVATALAHEGGVRATVDSDGIRVVVGMGPATLLDDDALGTLIARELLIARDHPAYGTIRGRSIGHLALSHDRMMDQFGRLARPYLAVSTLSFDRAKALAVATDHRFDAEAAAAIGGERLARAIALEACARVVYDAYWYDEIAPILARSLRPPLAAGAPVFAANRRTEDPELWSEMLEFAMGPLDHLRPTAQTRLDRLGVPEPDRDLPPAPPRDLADAEGTLLATLRGGSLIPVTWDEAISRAAESGWMEAIAAHRVWLSPLRLDAVPSTLRALRPDAGAPWFEDERAFALLSLFGVGLLHAGWELRVEPGRPLELTRGDETAQPFGLGWAIATLEADESDFAACCATWGVEELPQLDTLIDPADAPPSPGTPMPAALATAQLSTMPSAELLPEREVRLSQTAATRLVHLAGLLLIGAIALPIAIVTMSAAWFADADPALRIGMPITGLVLLGLFVVVFRATIWEVVGTPRLRSNANGDLTIDHPAMLRAPLRLSRDDLLAVDVDDTGRDRRFAVNDPRQLSSGQVVGWLWRYGTGATMPVLDATPDHPNIAIILREAVDAPRPRGRRPHGVLRGERIDGVLLRTKDPQAARELFSTLGVLRPVSVSDLQD
ncbi:MAG: hypothetical protein JHC95_05505 [Solirubrobacteraceae bacterium]|nr:hypothetical protein [Solirubrobacteraceae bacterium]